MVSSQRAQFGVLDLFRTAQGIRREDGYAVIPGDVARRIEDEFERLYALEDLLVEVMAEDAVLPLDKWRELRGLLGIVEGGDG